MIANNEDMLSFLLWLGQQACIFGLGNVSASIVPFSCGGASDAPQLAARVRRRRFTLSIIREKIAGKNSVKESLSALHHLQPLHPDGAV